MAGNTVSDDESRMHTAEEPGKVETYTQEGAARVSEVVGIVTTKEKRISRTAQKDKAEAEPFTVAEQMPAFPGGNDSLNVWFRRNLRYPSSAREAGITGRVYVGFVVSETGKVKDARIERSLQRDCDREALRLVRIMPSWIPGKQGGKAVAVRYVVPVDFSLP
jgi:protein TonB